LGSLRQQRHQHIGFLGTIDVRPLVIKTNGAEAMRVISEGRVSIGSLGGPRSPDFRLDVQGTLNADEIRKGGAPLVGSQWEQGESSGIGYSGGSVGIGTYDPQGKLDVNGDIRAGNSNIYFTRTDHNHTGIGNTAGYAAIENAANYGPLMILGRAGTSRGRYVRLWDYLQVNGGMDVTGPVGVGTDGPQVTLHAVGNRIRIDNGVGLSLDLRADGSALDLESNGADLYINNNGRPVRIRNQQSVSSRDLKENVADFTTREAAEAPHPPRYRSFIWSESILRSEFTGRCTSARENAPRARNRPASGPP
jgi:hypothetical protein